MQLFAITDEAGKTYNVVSDDINNALDLVSREKGFVDHADQAQEMDLEGSEFDIEKKTPYGAACYWDKRNGEIVYRVPGHEHGDGQRDTDENPVYLTTGMSDDEVDNLVNINALTDVAV